MVSRSSAKLTPSSSTSMTSRYASLRVLAPPQKEWQVPNKLGHEDKCYISKS